MAKKKQQAKREKPILTPDEKSNRTRRRMGVRAERRRIANENARQKK